jgi:hypothetical protein
MVVVAASAFRGVGCWIHQALVLWIPHIHFHPFRLLIPRFFFFFDDEAVSVISVVLFLDTYLLAAITAACA